MKKKIILKEMEKLRKKICQRPSSCYKTYTTIIVKQYKPDGIKKGKYPLCTNCRRIKRMKEKLQLIQTK